MWSRFFNSRYQRYSYWETSLENSSIYLRLRGGMGNQLFQYSAGRTLADNLGCNLMVDTKWYKSNSNIQNSVVRDYTLNHFKNARLKTIDDLPNFIPDRNENYFRYKMHKLFGRPSYIFYEKTHPLFDTTFNETPAGTYVAGEFQSEKYFTKNKRNIRNDLKFTSPRIDANAEMERRILEAKNSVSLHIRKGDYNFPPYSEILTSLSSEYYQSATNYIEEKTNISLSCFIFSNDPIWARENIYLDYDTTVVDINDEQSGHFDLYLQSICSHNIIANSTMSWWGGWLNSNVNKIVIAPKKWYTSNQWSTDDKYPYDWIVM